MTNTPLQDIQLFQTDAEIFDAWLHGAAGTTVEFAPGDVRPTLASLMGGGGVVQAAANYPATGAEAAIEATAVNITITINPALIVGRFRPLRVRNLNTAAGNVTISDGTNNVDEITMPAAKNASNSYKVNGWRDVSSSDGVTLRVEGEG